jgi:molybdopterin molybdotransferase
MGNDSAVTLEDARQALLDACRIATGKRTPLTKCWGRVLAEDITSDMDFPPFDRSPLDGYAVRMDDIRAASKRNPAALRQIEYLPAGGCPQLRVGVGDAARIMTGAKMPDGADAVVRLEDTYVEGQQVFILSSGENDKNICKRGEEFRAGELVLKKGSCVQEGAIGTLALLGRDKPMVYTKPKVGILATGSELLPVSAQLQPGMIRDTNSNMLDAKVRAAGGAPVMMGQVSDDVDAMIERIQSYPRLPIYLVTGGASVGDYDLTGRLFERLGIPILFDRVAIKPGMPVIAGRWGDSLIIALSGNPAACIVSFEVLVRPLIRRIAGFTQFEPIRIRAKLAGKFEKASPVRRFIWAICFVVDGILFATPLEHQGNGMLRAIDKANVLLDIPAKSPPLDRGQEVLAILLPTWV